MNDKPMGAFSPGASPIKATLTMSEKTIAYRSIAYLLHRATQRANQIVSSSSAVPRSALTLPQYIVLCAVADREGTSQTNLSAKTGIDRSTLADVVRRLVRKQLISRKRMRFDARVYEVRLTELGTRELASAHLIFTETNKRILDLMPKTLRGGFIAGLEAIADSSTNT